MLVRGRMTREVVTASPDTRLSDALSRMHERRIRHLPVLDEGRLVGIVSDRDLRSAVPAPGVVADAERQRMLGERTVGEIMVRDVVTVDPDTPMEDAARIMSQRRIGCLPVQASGGEVVGILSATDLLRGFVELFGVNKPSSRIEVRIPNRPGELARVVRLIGVESRINITGLVVPPVSSAESVAVIRVQTLDPRGIIEALAKMGYQVGWPALDLPSEEAPAPRTAG